MRDEQFCRGVKMGEDAKYRQLKVWQRGMEIVEQVYALTRSFPRDERWGLTSQMRRAASSIPMNVAEGNCRGTRRDYASFVATATGSVGELDTALDLAVRLGFARRDDVAPIAASLDEVGRMLRTLRTRLLAPPDSDPSSLIPHPSSP